MFGFRAVCRGCCENSLHELSEAAGNARLAWDAQCQNCFRNWLMEDDDVATVEIVLLKQPNAVPLRKVERIAR